MADLKEAQKFIVCGCGSLSHLVRIQYALWKKDDKPVDIDIALETFLNPSLGFMKRLYHGVRYVLGLDQKASMYEEIVLDEVKVQEIIEFLQAFQRDKESFQSPNTVHQ